MLKCMELFSCYNLKITLMPALFQADLFCYIHPEVLYYVVQYSTQKWTQSPCQCLQLILWCKNMQMRNRNKQRKCEQSVNTRKHY